MTIDPTPQGLKVFNDLLRLPPVPRMGSGLIAVVAGGGLGIAFWRNSYIWGLALFAVVTGILLYASGFLENRRIRRRDQLLESVRKRKDEIVSGMIDAKKQGKNPVRFLNGLGIQDQEIRGELIEEMNTRLRLNGPG